ncbi:MAG: superoxide dismutase family protein [bacterium]|nr:superoxide dismutase family protein [bacterium]
MAVAELMSPEGKKVGVVTFTNGEEGVRVVVHVQGLEPGYHGFHIHGTGKCVAPDFKSAGGHFNPFGKKHGIKSKDGTHVGDMPNLLVGPDGVGVAVVMVPMSTLGPGAGSLFQPEGTALVIHSGPDDYQSDPAGNAGARVACGVIKPLK